MTACFFYWTQFDLLAIVTIFCLSGWRPARQSFFGSFYFFQLGIDHRGKPFQAALLQALAVYKYGGDAPHAGPDPILCVSLNQFSNFGIIEVFLIFCHVEIEIDGDRTNFFIVELFVLFKKGIVKLPEFPLFAGCQGCLGRLLGKFMGREREIFINYLYFSGIFLDHLIE